MNLLRALIALLPASLLLSGCGGEEPSTEIDAGVPQVFIALSRDFEGYGSWKRFDLVATDSKDPHMAGARTVFINKLPPPGATEFPIGTIILKRIEGLETYAMVKRGGDFNPNGAKNWEWFGFENLEGGALKQEWRGTNGDNYGGPNETRRSCNTCHVAAVGNDFVQSPALKLPLAP